MVKSRNSGTPPEWRQLRIVTPHSVVFVVYSGVSSMILTGYRGLLSAPMLEMRSRSK